MTQPKRIVLRELARLDIDEAIAFYLADHAVFAAMGFVEVLEKAYEHLRLHPRSGSPRFAHELNLPGLRSWSLNRYPYVIFYMEQPDYVDVWRILHGSRDIPSWMLS
ncbi:MAG: type II toxin-antitoxin system RelE/ParE family toxin [Burkholderiaceae bacterium]|jgi:toxin ParE1/3/4